jgi:hypothetical protein
VIVPLAFVVQPVRMQSNPVSVGVLRVESVSVGIVIPTLLILTVRTVSVRTANSRYGKCYSGSIPDLESGGESSILSFPTK